MSNRQKVIQKVKDFVQDKYSGDWNKAFLAYSREDGKLNSDELHRVLQDAEVGNMVTRIVYVGQIMSVLDSDGDERISEEEFLFAFSRG